MSRNLLGRLARLEASMVPRGLTPEQLEALTDEELDAYAERLSAHLPPAERERTRAWLAGLSDEALEAVIAGGRR